MYTLHTLAFLASKFSNFGFIVLSPHLGSCCVGPGAKEKSSQKLAQHSVKAGGFCDQFAI